MCAVESELCSNSSVPPFGALLRKRAVGAADVSVEQTASWAAASWITEAIRASGAELQRPLMAPCDTPLPSARKRRCSVLGEEVTARARSESAIEAGSSP